MRRFSVGRNRSVEYNGFIFVDQHFAFDVLLDGPRQDDLFEIFPFVDQIGDRILVRDANDLLFDDRAGVQFGSDIVAGRPDDLYAAFEKPHDTVSPR